MTAQLRSLVWAALRWPSRMVYRRALAEQKWTVPQGVPKLNYGGALPRESGAVVAGGRVKLRHLDRAFPEHENFNVLYLVSSAAPRHAADLVRWAKAQGAKFVWNQNGVAFPAWAGARCGETNRPMAELLRMADFVVYQSAFCRESADRFLGPAVSPSQVLFNPVDLREFSPAQTPPPLDCWRLLAAGTHYQPARVLGPIEALRLLRDGGKAAHLTIAGELRWPNAAAEIRDVIDRSNLGELVTLRPAFSQAEAVALHRGAHVLLHTKYHDPCPTIVIEALACGVPVIGSRSGGMPELVGEERGELIEVPLSWESASAPEPAKLAEAIIRIMEAWPKRSQAARLQAERLFDADRWVAEHREIFETLLAS